MNENYNIERRRDLLESIANISGNMRDIIYQKFYDEVDKKHRRILHLFDDSFMSAFMVCECLRNGAIAQSAVILRLLLESESIIHILSEHPEVLDEFMKHFDIRLEVSKNPKKERDTLKNYFPDVESKILSYMDYGWINSLTDNDPSEKEMIKVANFNDIIAWKDQYLDKLSHQAYLSVNMIGENYDFPIITNFVKILGKLFDYMCCDFHKLTGFDFVIDGKDMFQGWFRPVYDDFTKEDIEIKC